MRSGFGGLLAAGVIAAPSGAAQAADPVKRLSARSGTVSAAVSWRDTKDACPDFRATVVKAGKTLVKTSLRRFRACDFWPFVEPRTLRVRDLDGDGEPEVLFDVFVGGLRCCLHNYTLIFAFRSGRYASAYQPFGPTSYVIRDPDADGRLELVSRDPAFSCLPVYCGADFVLPIRIWRWQGRKLADVTREFPGLIASHAGWLLRLYDRARKRRAPENVRAILPAYLAEQYLLGRERRGWRLVERAYARGELGRSTTEPDFPTGRRYVRLLRTFFRTSRYAR